MIQEIQDSQYWTDINQLILTVENEIYKKKHIKGNTNDRLDDKDYAVFVDNLGGKSFEEYLLIGLRNTKKKGFNLRKDMVRLSDLKMWVKFKFESDEDDENYYLVAVEDYEYIIINDSKNKTIRMKKSDGDINVIYV